MDMQEENWDVAGAEISASATSTSTASATATPLRTVRSVCEGSLGPERSRCLELPWSQMLRVVVAPASAWTPRGSSPMAQTCFQQGHLSSVSVPGPLL